MPSPTAELYLQSYFMLFHAGVLQIAFIDFLEESATSITNAVYRIFEVGLTNSLLIEGFVVKHYL
jgi:hypothetical protein